MRRVGANNSGAVSLSSSSDNNVKNLSAGAGTTIISAVENSTGVIVRSLIVGGNSGNHRSALIAVDGVYVMTATMENSLELWTMADELILQPGQVLSAVANNSGCDAMATWDELP